MKVGCLERSLPMVLECCNEKRGIYNLYAPGQLDIDFIVNTLKNPPEGCRFITLFSRDGRDFEDIVKYFNDYYFEGKGKYFKMKSQHFDYIVIDLRKE